MSITVAPHASSILRFVAGTQAPGSPATITRWMELSAGSVPTCLMVAARNKA